MMRVFSLAALAAAFVLIGSASASAFVFDESESGVAIALPGGWVEKDQGRQDMFGGCWEVDFTGPSKTSIFVAIVRADPKKFAGAQQWAKNEVIGLRGKTGKDSFLPYYARKYSGRYSYEEAEENAVKLASGEPATLTTMVKLEINGAHPNVAFVAFEKSGFWYVAVVFNDERGIEKLGDTVNALLESTSFPPPPAKVGSLQ